MNFSRNDIAQLAASLTNTVNIRYYWVSEAQAALRPDDRPEVPGWHIVIFCEDNGYQFFRKLILSPTNTITIFNGLNTGVLTPEVEERLINAGKAMQAKLYEDVALARLMTREPA